MANRNGSPHPVPGTSPQPGRRLNGPDRRGTHRLQVLGRPFELLCSHPRVAELAIGRFDRWTAAGGDPGDDGPAFRLDIVVRSRRAPSARRPGWIERLDRQVLDLAGPGIRGRADRQRRSGRLLVDSASLEDTTSFVRNYLECVVLYLATAVDRTPVHAALALGQRSAVLLAGPTGAGKSTLSYGLLQAGWDVVADDTVYVDLADGARMWSYLPDLRLDGRAADVYPELARSSRLVLPDGQCKLVVAPPREDGDRRSRSYRGEAAICFLERTGRSAEVLRRIEAGDAAKRLWGERPPGFDLDPAYREVVETLSRNPAFLVDTSYPVQACLDAVAAAAGGGTR